MKFRFSLFYFLFAFLGCSSSNGDIDKPENNGGAEEGNIEVSGDKVIVTPLSYDQAFRNPMMGWRFLSVWTLFQPIIRFHTDLYTKNTFLGIA